MTEGLGIGIFNYFGHTVSLIEERLRRKQEGYVIGCDPLEGLEKGDKIRKNGKMELIISVDEESIYSLSQHRRGAIGIRYKISKGKLLAQNYIVFDKGTENFGMAKACLMSHKLIRGSL